MSTDWDSQIHDFWKRADGSNPQGLIAEMEQLVAQLPAGSPEGFFELASVHDFFGNEELAIPLYERALESGLAGLKREKAIIQLASSLRNVGRAADAMVLLESNSFGPDTAKAAKAFLALATFDSGNPAGALATAIEGLYPQTAMYARSLANYAKELTK
jgi:hypothetical protein